MTENLSALDPSAREQLAYEQKLDLREAIRHLQKFIHIGGMGKHHNIKEIKTPQRGLEIYNDLVKLFEEEYEKEQT